MGGLRNGDFGEQRDLGIREEGIEGLKRVAIIDSKMEEKNRRFEGLGV